MLDNFDNKKLTTLSKLVVYTLFIFYLLLNTSTLLAQSTAKKITLRGFVREANSNETLPGAHVRLQGSNQGTATNNYGYYSLVLPAGRVQLIFSYVGYAQQEQTIELHRDTVLDIALEPEEIEQVVIEGKSLNESSRSSRMGTLQLTKRSITEVPMLLGERDVMRVVQLLPGVNKGQEGTSGLYVRGGGPDQNLIILDDAPVYNAHHLLGMFSLFSGSAIKNVELVKGGFPARYGGRLASVLDIVMEEGNMREYHGSLTVGLVATQGAVQGPIVKDKVSFLVTGRRTYADLLLAPATTRMEVRPVFYFYDLTAKLNWQINTRDRIYLSGYIGSDKFGAKSLKTADLNLDVGITWGNITGSLRWNHLWRANAFSNLTATYSSYDLLSYVTLKLPPNEFQQNFFSGIKNISLKHDTHWTQWEGHALRFGAQTTGYRFVPMATTLKVTHRNIRENAQTALHSLDAALYAEDDMRLWEWGRLNLGLRAAYYGIERSHSFFLEPRASATFYLTGDMSIKAGYALMNQNLHLLTSTGIGLPTDLWIPATTKLPPQQAWIASLGGVYDLDRIQSFVSIEGYYRQSKGNIMYREGASYLSVDELTGQKGRYWEDKVSRGRSWSAGIEFLFQRKAGNLTGWLGYTLSWTRVQFPDLNHGKSFWATYDRRHDISIVAMYHFNERWRMALTWVYGTGNAFTLPQALITHRAHPQQKAKDYASEFIDYGEINGVRMGATHRLDIGVQWVKKLKYAEQILSFDIYNAYAHRNPFFYTISSKQSRNPFVDESYYTRYVLQKFSLFPLIPSISLTYNF